MVFEMGCWDVGHLLVFRLQVLASNAMARRRASVEKAFTSRGMRHYCFLDVCGRRGDMVLRVVFALIVDYKLDQCGRGWGGRNHKQPPPSPLQNCGTRVQKHCLLKSIEQERLATKSHRVILVFRCGSEEGSVRQPLRKEHKNI